MKYIRKNYIIFLTIIVSATFIISTNAVFIKSINTNKVVEMNLNINFDLTNEETKEIIIDPQSEKIININIQNNKQLDLFYGIYYRMILPEESPTGFNIGEIKQLNDVISTNGTIIQGKNQEILIGITNHTYESVVIEVGVRSDEDNIIYQNGQVSINSFIELQQQNYVQDGLVLWYDGIYNAGLKNEHSSNTTTWVDLSGNGNDGVINSGSWGTDHLTFDGTNTYVKVGNNFKLPATSPVTVEIVYSIDRLIITNTSDTSQGTVNALVSQSSGQDGRMVFSIDGRRYYSHYNLRMFHNNGTTGFNLYETNNMMNQANTIYLSGFVRNDNNFTMFTNGIKTENISQYDLNFKDPGEVLIGSAVAYTNNYKNSLLDGNIYAVRVYNRALSSAELNRNYQLDKSRHGF